MRSRRRITWLVYGVCVAFVALVLGLVSWQALRLERQEQRARQETTRQEAVRLALWRMDSRLTPILVREAARPYFHYRSFFPSERAYARMWEPMLPDETLAPSPLLGPAVAGQDDPDVGLILIHFQSEPDGSLTSPQAPSGVMLALAQTGFATDEALERSGGLLGRLGDLLDPNAMVGGQRRAEQQTGRIGMAQDENINAPKDEGGYGFSEEAAREFQARQQATELAQRNVTSQNAFPISRAAPGESDEVAGGLLESEINGVEDALAKSSELGSEERDKVGYDESTATGAVSDLDDRADTNNGVLLSSGVEVRVRLDSFEASWIGVESVPELIFVREAQIDGRAYRQGFWVDWAALSAVLVASVEDLLPDARLEPAVGGMTTLNATPELLASVPVRLDPGAIPPVAAAGLTATRGMLLMSWLALGAATIAIGFVLRAAIELSERRGRFVSAVTHELRTPLTTFRLYAQMLADGMVSDEDARREYLATLKSESGRLSGIVENVLEYARLSRRKSGPEQTLEMAPEALLVRLRPTLSRRAEQSGMDLIVSADLEDANRDGVKLTIDPQSVERILMNLVENACKYAGPAEGEDDDDLDPRIHLDVRVTGGQLEFLIADYGPGIPARDRARVFGEFQRGAARPMRSGLGLGLALSRGLAREGGGDLRLVRRRGHGAEFLLSLPVHSPPVSVATGAA